MKSEIFLNTRVLFIIENCEMCQQYKKFIEELNMNLPIDKKIDVVYVDEYYDYGIILNPIIHAYKKYLDGNFPDLFFEGSRLKGAVEKDVLKCFIKALTYGDNTLYIPGDSSYYPPEYYFDKSCKFVETKLLGTKVMCQ